MYHPYYGGHALGLGLVGLFLSVLFWILIIWLVVAVIRHFVGGGSHRHERWQRWHEMKHGNSGISILNERYAKGEISKEEYEVKKKDILGS